MRSRWTFLSVGIVIAAYGAVACGGEDAEKRSPYEKFSADYAKSFCSALAPCCTFTAFSVEECRTWLGLAVVFEAGEARESKFVFHQDRADQCLADMRSQSICTGVEPASCRAVVEGLVPGGESCRSNAECMSSERSSATCDFGDDDEGVCLFPGRAAARGEACASDCDDGGAFECNATEPGMDTFCYRDTGLTCTNGTCQDLPGVGAMCAGFGDCAAGAACNAGVCVALAGPGAACTSSSGCREELYCANGACAARVPAGSACDVAVDPCLNGSCINGRCADFLLETACLFGALE